MTLSITILNTTHSIETLNIATLRKMTLGMTIKSIIRITANDTHYK